jgi:hypothetical protein
VLRAFVRLVDLPAAVRDAVASAYPDLRDLLNVAAGAGLELDLGEAVVVGTTPPGRGGLVAPRYGPAPTTLAVLAEAVRLAVDRRAQEQADAEEIDRARRLAQAKQLEEDERLRARLVAAAAEQEQAAALRKRRGG